MASRCASGDIGRTGSTGAMLSVTAVLPAGHVTPRRLGKGEAARIMTGAMVPEGADAVIPVEELEFMRGPNNEEQVRVRRAPNAGENVREAGMDLAAGAVALGAGHPLSPHDLALLAALGVAEPTVGRQPRVAVISTGDELLAPKDALTPGAIRDSNLPMLTALLTEAGTSVVSAHHASDDPARLADHVRAALALADVVITIGGVSAGRLRSGEAGALEARQHRAVGSGHAPGQAAGVRPSGRTALLRASGEPRLGRVRVRSTRAPRTPAHGGLHGDRAAADHGPRGGGYRVTRGRTDFRARDPGATRGWMVGDAGGCARCRGTSRRSHGRTHCSSCPSQPHGSRPANPRRLWCCAGRTRRRREPAAPRPLIPPTGGWCAEAPRRWRASRRRSLTRQCCSRC
jgi:hypothetical protein